MKNKHVFRAVAYLLVLVAALSVFVQPAFAANVITETVLTPNEKNVYSASKVHRNPYYSSTEIGCFKNGTKLTVLDETREFYKVDCYDMVGYIAKSQVSANENGEYYVNCIKDSDETKYLPYYTMQKTLELRHDLLKVAKEYIGVPYVSGGTSRWGFDCSGYTQYVFNEMDVAIDRTEWCQMADGIIVAKEDLQCGDLVIFSYTGENGGFASHIGIYIGNDQVIHASSRGVTISDLNSAYYANHYQCARRVILEEESFALTIPATGIMQNVSGSYWREEKTEESIFIGM